MDYGPRRCLPRNWCSAIFQGARLPEIGSEQNSGVNHWFMKHLHAYANIQCRKQRVVFMRFYLRYSHSDALARNNKQREKGPWAFRAYCLLSVRLLNSYLWLLGGHCCELGDWMVAGYVLMPICACWVHSDVHFVPIGAYCMLIGCSMVAYWCLLGARSTPHVCILNADGDPGCLLQMYWVHIWVLNARLVPVECPLDQKMRK